MGNVFLWLIETPAQLIGSLVAALWPLLAFVVAIGVGRLTFLILEDKLPTKAAAGAGIFLGIYAGMVMYDAQKWTGVALIRQHEADDDY